MIRIVMGPPCGGKSTYVSERAEKGDLIIDYDLIAKALGAPISHAADGIIKQAAFDARESAILRALDAPKKTHGLSIHHQPRNISKDMRLLELNLWSSTPGVKLALKEPKQMNDLSRLLMALRNIMLRRKERQRCYTKP